MESAYTGVISYPIALVVDAQSMEVVADCYEDWKVLGPMEYMEMLEVCFELNTEIVFQMIGAPLSQRREPRLMGRVPASQPPVRGFPSSARSSTITIGCTSRSTLARRVLSPFAMAVARPLRRRSQEGAMIRIALADDHAIVREGLRLLLELEPGFEVVGEAGDGLEALCLVHRTRPDVLLLDLVMPGLGGIEVARRLSVTAPLTRVLFLTGCADEIRVRQAFGVGAAGYMVKGASCARLIEAIHDIAAGRYYLSPPFSDRGLSAFIGGVAPGPLLAELLTPREIEVLHLAAQGLTARGIAERLSISHRTAEAHKGNLMRKLGLHNQTDLVCFAIANGLVEAESPR